MPHRYSQQDAHEFYLYALSGLAGPQAVQQEPDQAQQTAAPEGPAAGRILPPAELAPMLPMLTGVPSVIIAPQTGVAGGCSAALLRHAQDTKSCSGQWQVGRALVADSMVQLQGWHLKVDVRLQ